MSIHTNTRCIVRLYVQHFSQLQRTRNVIAQALLLIERHNLYVTDILFKTYGRKVVTFQQNHIREQLDGMSDYDNASNEHAE